MDIETLLEYQRALTAVEDSNQRVRNAGSSDTLNAAVAEHLNNRRALSRAAKDLNSNTVDFEAAGYEAPPYRDADKPKDPEPDSKTKPADDNPSEFFGHSEAPAGAPASEPPVS